ncbi:MAG: hypothetical protein COX62_07915 [Deltaproteobacteria bacterium CG_4_10_14_0_2_um_filter_43_8]|nr:MAG: hypothetical protein COV43_04655 [Deltaproteobacteria bacterium CG11_big_fil_rev_8_21_14_0_20_42_23]PJA18855.1 MAG: hypothetical protein COX62_07915 [Deltaproteobacteria bacterium CG_4_10_14_0_2_um_filter_43_8]PJC65066.1 MAG: hypothetical protein CO021_01045 [Deltaproteobacteria bacterium CG_4_9_14_0_2_um_filter_42_21]
MPYPGRKWNANINELFSFSWWVGRKIKHLQQTPEFPIRGEILKIFRLEATWMQRVFLDKISKIRSLDGYVQGKNEQKKALQYEALFLEI